MFYANLGHSGLVVNVFDYGVRGPRFESHHGRLCLSRQPLRYTALGTFTAVPRLTQPSTLHGMVK